MYTAQDIHTFTKIVNKNVLEEHALAFSKRVLDMTQSLRGALKMCPSQMATIDCYREKYLCNLMIWRTKRFEQRVENLQDAVLSIDEPAVHHYLSSLFMESSYQGLHVIFTSINNHYLGSEWIVREYDPTMYEFYLKNVEMCIDRINSHANQVKAKGVIIAYNVSENTKLDASTQHLELKQYLNGKRFKTLGFIAFNKLKMQTFF